jgi:hypothetical protein
VWESEWDGYEPNDWDNERSLQGLPLSAPLKRQWMRNGLRFHQQGIDYGKSMLEGCRNKLNGWISLRMNRQQVFRLRSPGGARTLSGSREVLQRYDMCGLELDFMRMDSTFARGRNKKEHGSRPGLSVGISATALVCFGGRLGTIIGNRIALYRWLLSSAAWPVCSWVFTGRATPISTRVGTVVGIGVTTY